MKQYHEALFLSYRPRTECSISRFCITNCTHSIFRTIEGRVGFAWAFSETVKTISNITYTASKRVLTFDKHQSRLFKLRLIELYAKRIYYVYFLSNSFMTMCNLQKRLIRVIFTTPASDVYERLKTNGTAIKIAKRLLTINNKRKIIRWNIYRDNNFHSRRQVLKCLWKSLFIVYVLSRLPGVCFFQRWTRGTKIAQSFLLQPEL